MNYHQVPTLEQLMNARWSRRNLLQRFAAAGVGAIVASAQGLPQATAAPLDATTLGFREIQHGVDEQVHVPAGYRCEVIARWGDRVLPDAPEFDVNLQTAAAQEQQFGYNADFVTFMPLPLGSHNSHHGLLCVNFEYTNPELMFAGITEANKLDRLTREQVDIEMAAHGHGVIEIKRHNGSWQAVAHSPHNRRISARSTEILISGPAAGHPRMRTSADPSGRKVIGSLNNCAGGTTPWGTVLVAEENFQDYFGGDPERTSEAANHRLYGLGQPEYAWFKFYDRFHVEREPHEPNRFGWVVEFDLYDPNSVPVKRTALGRLRHEGATTAIAPDGRVVAYSGDDQRFQYLYRFVSQRQFNPRDRAANRDLLDEGTLYVAQFHQDGRLQWLPLVHGTGPLTGANGFASQADVLIETRRAATLVGATPMDRPEDVEVNPRTGRVFVLLTNNTERETGDAMGANPRKANKHGHIIELTPPDRAGQPDHAADGFRWDIFLLAGNPRDPQDQARYHRQVTPDGWLSCPDNCTFDNEGRMWIATDGAPKATPDRMADGVYACDTRGPGRALTRMFFRAPFGAEVCGPAFTPDNTTFFVAVQHPGESSTFDEPSTRWPDFDPRMPPRPSVIAISREDGGPVGG